MLHKLPLPYWPQLTSRSLFRKARFLDHILFWRLLPPVQLQHLRKSDLCCQSPLLHHILFLNELNNSLLLRFCIWVASDCNFHIFPPIFINHLSNPIARLRFRVQYVLVRHPKSFLPCIQYRWHLSLLLRQPSAP